MQMEGMVEQNFDKYNGYYSMKSSNSPSRGTMT